MSQSSPAAEHVGAAPPHPEPGPVAADGPLDTPADPAAAARAWRRAGRDMVAKALGEFAYEDLLSPVPDGAGGHYRIDLPGDVRYSFTARRGAYDCWHVDAESVTRRWDGGNDPADDMLQFLLDTHSALGLTGDTAGHLVRELTATLSADARALTGAASAAALADLGYAELEGHQTGHPWLVPNKGRVGFSARDALVYPPEARRPLRLPWIAVHSTLARFRAVPGLTHEQLHGEQLDPDTIAGFRARLIERGLDADAYLWLPVHPWQWEETIATLFAADVAHGRVVYLGEAPDLHLAQQSVRTFLNVDRPRRRTVKLPLSVLNTLVWRGLPTERTEAAPAVTSWVLGLCDGDAYLRDECGVVLLGETASVTVRHPVLEELPGVPYQYRELLGAIWREPLATQLAPGERARTLASLLHVDPAGRPFVVELVERSGIPPRAWLGRLFGALLPPLLHCLYRYGLVFSPHGENAIVVFDGRDVPARLAIKDFVDDVNISDQPLPELADLPAEVSRVLLRSAPAYLCQFLHAGLLVGHFRYLADLAGRHLGVPQTEFWALVRDEVLRYQRRFPELRERFGLFDLLTPRIDRLCLNRNRLLLDGYRDRPTRPHVAAHGTVPNPLSAASLPDPDEPVGRNLADSPMV